MNDSKSWRRHSDGRTEYREERSVLRMIFGAVMASFGALFLAAMIFGLFRPGGWESAAARPGSTLAVMGFTLFFFVVGWLVVVHRVRIVLNPAAREVAVVHDFFPFAHKRVLRLDDFRAAVITTRQTASTAGNRAECAYSVRLVKPDKKSELVASLYSVTDASRLGNNIAKMLRSDWIEMSDSHWDKFSA